MHSLYLEQNVARLTCDLAKKSIAENRTIYRTGIALNEAFMNTHRRAIFNLILIIITGVCLFAMLHAYQH